MFSLAPPDQSQAQSSSSSLSNIGATASGPSLTGLQGGGASLLWGRQMSGGDERPWPSAGMGAAKDEQSPFHGFPAGLEPLGATGSSASASSERRPGLLLPPGDPLFPFGNLGGSNRFPLGLLGGLGTNGVGVGLGGLPGFPLHALPDIVPLTEAELAAVERSRPWEREDLQALNKVHPDYQFAASEATNVTLGPFKELAVMYVNSRLPLEARLHKTVANRVLVVNADQVGLKPLVYRLHLQNAERMPTPESMLLFVRMRATQKLRSEQRKLERSERIHLHSTNAGSIEYFEGIDLVIGRERDSVIRPMLNRYFRTHRSQCRAALDSVGLRLQDLRSWTGVELCKGLWVLSLHVDDAIWRTAVQLHLQKAVRRRATLRP